MTSLRLTLACLVLLPLCASAEEPTMVAPPPLKPMLPSQAGAPDPGFAPPKGGVGITAQSPGSSVVVGANTGNLKAGDFFTRKFGDKQQCADGVPGTIILVEYKKTESGSHAESAKIVRAKCKEQEPAKLPVKDLVISQGLTFRYDDRKFQEVP